MNRFVPQNTKIKYVSSELYISLFGKCSHFHFVNTNSSISGKIKLIKAFSINKEGSFQLPSQKPGRSTTIIHVAPVEAAPFLPAMGN